MPAFLHFYPGLSKEAFYDLDIDHYEALRDFMLKVQDQIDGA